MILQGLITAIYYYNAKKYLKCSNMTSFQPWITVLEGVPVHGGESEQDGAYGLKPFHAIVILCPEIL